MDKKSNSISPKTRDANGITIVKVAAFAFAIVSWNATADGLSTYIFTESQWMATLISFGIQSILFVLNLRLPFYYHKIGENCPNRETRKYHWGNKKGQEKKTYKSTSFQRAIILFYVMLLSSSSFFSFVYSIFPFASFPLQGARELHLHSAIRICFIFHTSLYPPPHTHTHTGGFYFFSFSLFISAT